VFEAASAKHPDVVFAKVNSDEQQELSSQFGIRSIPTLMVFRQQVILFSEPGAMSGRDLDGVVEQARTLDMDEVRRQIAAQQSQQQ
jgi:thioredoxin-like negative regulator of GroEL